MSENKRKKKKRRKTNKSQKKEKTDVVCLKENESKAQLFRKSPDRTRRGTFSGVFSRITNAFARRDRDVSNAETISKVSCETERAMSLTSFSSTGPVGRLSRKDVFEHKEITSRRDLFEAMLELCKPRLSPHIEAKIPMMKCLYQEVDHYVTSVLIELFNNEPKLSKGNPMMGELLNNIINKGKACDMNLKTTRKQQNRKYILKKTDVVKKSDCTAAQNILHETRFPKFLSHHPCSLFRFLRTLSNASYKDSDISERPEKWTEALPASLGRHDRSKLPKNSPAEKIIARVAETKVTEIPCKIVEGAKIIRSSLIRRTDVGENVRNTDIFLSPKRRLDFRTGNLLNLSEVYSLENTAPETNSHLDQRIDRKLPYAMVKRNRMFSRISFEIGRETHILCMDVTAMESFWRLMQRLLNSLQLRRPFTQRLEYNRSTDAVIQYRRNEQMANITVLAEMGSLTVVSVPISVIKLLLNMFNRCLPAVSAPNIVVGRYKIPNSCRYRSTPKRLHLSNGNQEIYTETLRDALQLKHRSSFWRHFPPANETHIVWKSNTAIEDNGTAEAKEEDSKISHEMLTPGIETSNEIILDDGLYNLSEHPIKAVEANFKAKHTKVEKIKDHRTKSYDAESNDVRLVHTNLAEREDKGSESDEDTSKDVCTTLDKLEDKGTAAPKLFAERYAKVKECVKLKEGAKAKDYQNFDEQVPDNLLHIKIPSIDITEVDFETDMDGNRAIFVSGGFGDVCQAYLSTTEEEVIVKIVKNMTYEDVLRESRIQTYLMTRVSVPKLLGIIGGPEKQETMIVQQMCAKGRTLYDLIEACLAESVVLFKKQWLELCYQLAINLENMHDKGILHNDIKTDNILVELKPNDVRIYFIDFGQATFRSGGILHFDEGDDSDDTEDYLAPEVCWGLQSSPKSDIYSLGVIFADIADEFCEWLGQLAGDMCEQEPAQRPTLEEVTETLEEIIMEYEYT